MQQKLEKWRRWLSIIEDEVRHLLIAQHVFSSLRSLVDCNDALHRPNLFYRYLGDSYAALVLMGIRRQIKKDKDSISMVRLLEEFQQSPCLLTRDGFRCRYVGCVNERLADRDFDRFCDKPSDPYVSVVKISKDIEKLASISASFESYIDRRIAHRDKAEPKAIPDMDAVDACLERLDGLCSEYYLLLTGVFRLSWFSGKWRMAAFG